MALSYLGKAITMLTPTLIARGAVYPPAVNRDGSQLAWSDRTEGSRDLFLHENGETRRLTRDEEVDIEPALTPAGDRLVWSRRVDKDWELFEMVEGKPTLVHGGPGAQRKPVFSDDASTLVFEDDGGIGVVRDGKRERIALPEGAEISRKPQVSEDGTRVFWERYDTSTRGKSLWMKDEAGVEKPLLSADSGWTGAAISRNGRQVTYSAFSESGTEDLMVWHLDTNQRHPIADKAAVGEMFPAVSSDGSTSYYNLVDFRGYPKVNAYIYRDRDGEKDELVGRHPLGRDLFPQLSPDDGQMNWVWVSDDDPADRALYTMGVG